MVKEAVTTFVVAAKKGEPMRMIRKGFRPKASDKVLKTHADYFQEVVENETHTRAFTAVAPPGEPQEKPE